MTRFMGLFCREASPVSLEVNSWPARIPVSRRMVVPELPASRARQLPLSPCSPRPETRTASLSIFTSAPNALMQPSVLWQSAEAAKWRNSLVPSARAANMA
jgi:hypothetical protein